MTTDQTMTLKEVAEELRVHPKTLKRWLLKNSTIPYFRVGPKQNIRIKQSDLTAYKKVSETSARLEGKPTLTR